MHGTKPAARLVKKMITETLDELIKLFCKRNGIYEPYDAKDTEKVLERMKAVGLVDQKDIDNFKDGVKAKNSK